MFRKLAKGIVMLSAVLAVTFVSASVAKASCAPGAHNWSNNDGICVTCGDSCTHSWSSGVCSTCGFVCTHPANTFVQSGDRHNKECNDCNFVIDSHSKNWNRSGLCQDCDLACPHSSKRWVIENSYHRYQCSECYVTFHEHLQWANKTDSELTWVDAYNGKIGRADNCGYTGYAAGGTCSLSVEKHRPNPSTPKTEDKKEEKKEEKSSSSSSTPKNDPFGGRSGAQLSVAEQKIAVASSLDVLRANGNALPANVVTTNSGNGGSKTDIAAVVADTRDAINQQIFANMMCQNLGFKNVTPLMTYNMYALKSSYVEKNKAQVISWANTGLKPGDTAFVVWYNQILGRIDLLPAIVDAFGNVSVSVPALGDVSTMTVVKASK